MGSDEPITLTDTQGNEIMDSEGTRSSQFWKQNSRKIYAVPESDFVEFQNGRRAKTSRRDGDSSLQEVLGRVDQLKQAAGSLQEVTNSINQLSQLAKSQKEEIMANVGLQPLKEAFACLVCKGTCKICNSRSFYSTKHSRLPPSSTALTSCHGCSSPSSTFTQR
ncbi:unnamed protein product [Boreogadus saida]